MLNFLSPPPSTQKLLVCNTSIDLRAAEAFICDLYENAGLPLPEIFDPVEEIIRVVTILREQGRNQL